MLVGEKLDALLILFIVALMTLMGALQEYRAEKLLEKLRTLASPKARVVRDGKQIEIDSRMLVPGDIIVLFEGDRVPADARLIEDRDLYVDESMLTGESIPVRKQANIVLPRDTIESDRVNMVYAGTYVVRGYGKAVVVATGLNAYIGRIARRIAETKESRTPLQIELDRLAKRVAVIVILIAAASFAVGYVSGGASLLDLALTSIALAVAAVPEGLPAIVVIVLSIAARRMASRNALIRRLSAVEALGAASLIASDKTGTITLNEMTVKKLVSPDGEEYGVSGEGYSFAGEVYSRDGRRLVAKENKWAMLLAQVALLNNNAEIIDGAIRGDPLEAALIALAAKLGLEPGAWRRRCRRLREISFTSERKMMTVIVDCDGQLLVLSKGAPEIIVDKSNAYMMRDGSILPLTPGDVERVLSIVEREADRGFRVIALAYRQASQYDLEADSEHVESKLILLGFACLIDPPRPEVPEAVRKALEAGIKVVIVTGDHPATARAIASMIGLPVGRVVTGWELENMDDSELASIAEHVTIYARTTPEHKARIVRVYQKLGHVVAVTGDGVNDAPALKLADIGVAMGKRGTDVAKEAADIILLDDNFATIIAAVEEGRKGFDNVKKTVLYLLSANIAEVAVTFYAAIRGLGVIFTAPMLLWINLVTDSFPAAGLAFEGAEGNVMRRPPRRKGQPLLGRTQLAYLMTIGLLITVMSVYLYHYYSAEGGHQLGASAAFLALMSSELALSMSIRRINTPLKLPVLLNNRQWLLGYVAGLALSVSAVTFLAPVFNIATLPAAEIAAIILLSHATLLGFEEARKRLGYKV